MSTQFGWWQRDAKQGKYQIRVRVHGGNIEWMRHQGHHTAWEAHVPSEEDRERLISEAQRRLPRRLLTAKQFEEIVRLSAREGPGRISGRSKHLPKVPYGA